MNKNALVGAILASTLGAAVFAHNGATGLVMDRMNGMTAMRDVMRDLAPMMQGSAEFDVRAVQTAAATLMAHAGDNMSKLFPEEPIPAASYAREEIWRDWAEFASLSEDLRTYAMGLAVAAPNALTTPNPSVDLSTDALMVDHSAMQMAPAHEAFSIAQLMGVEPLRETIRTTVPTASGATSETALAINFAMMAADDAFEMVSQTCASCHAQFRRGN
jgi:cytochrome c556